MENKVKMRKSGIELIKILAIVLIVISHTVQTLGGVIHILNQTMVLNTSLHLMT